MTLIYQAGQVQQTGQIVPQLFVSIQQPSQVALNGVSTQRIGIIGTASWGPVNTPVALSDIAGYRSSFGEKQDGDADMGVAVSVAQLQGANDFRCVRVTDGTDVAATGTLSGVTFTAVYTGTTGNALTVSLSQIGTSSNWQLTTSHAVLGSRAYSGANWSSLQAEVSADGSAFIAVTLPAVAPALATGTVTLSGGTNGGAQTSVQFVGSDDSDARTGMYALRNQGCAIGFIHGLTDTTLAGVIGTFGMSEGIYMIASGPSGDTISNAIALSASVGYKSYGLKMMFGDWLYYDDDTLDTVLISPQSFVAGRLATLAPSESSLNKQIAGIDGSQKAGLVSTGSSKTYSSAELTELFTAGIDVVCNPVPGGSYWAVRGGYNTSLNTQTWGDEYTRLTNYIAESLAGGMGAYIGEPINGTLFGDVRASILGLLSDMRGAGYLDNTGTTVPYTVVCDTSNNPQSRTAIGYLQADVQVEYMGINRFFNINLQGGAGVSVTVSNG
ncbi:phage tail sheath protein [Acetobacter aceti]|uniref:phage tail protein n=1 Tax=Acetobacter aceti TaxID=435 RepID=UPI000C06B7AC|nr:phage tail protein [Acetobacter aceti]